MASSGCAENVLTLSIKRFKIKLSLVKVLGDGSCFFHSVLRAFHTNYIRASSIEERKAHARHLRVAIAQTLDEIDETTGKTNYALLGGGYYADFNNAVSAVEGDKYSLAGLKRELLSSDAVDHAYIQLISDHIGLDIYLISSRTGDLYPVGSDTSLLYKERNSIVIFYSPGHYDIIGIKRIAQDNSPGYYNKGDIVFDCLFHPQHDFIVLLRARMAELVVSA
jgi:hypothetical protein